MKQHKDITNQIMDMYNKYPYPSPEIGRKDLKELTYLLRLFTTENRIDLNGKKILDAGTGTGHRLSHAAKVFAGSEFTAIDYCETSLSIARKTGQSQGLTNVSYASANLMDELGRFGVFDMIMCIGVLHHLAKPKTGLYNMAKILNRNGVILLWLYGKIGGAERMRRKSIVRTLLQGKKHDFDCGIQLVKDLNFDKFEFGWNLDDVTESERDNLIVDAFLNVNETLYDVDMIDNLMSGSGLSGYVVNGITSGESAFLFDTELTKETPLHCKKTNVLGFFDTELLKESYDALSIREKYRLIDLFFAPSGYTVMGFTEGFVESSLPKNGRLRRNLIMIND